MKPRNIAMNDNGAVLISIMLLLLLLVLMGKTAITSSRIEREIANNQQFYKKTLFSAEAGLEHVKEKLQTEFSKRNRTRIASGQGPDWDFALCGTLPDIDPAKDTNFDGGAVWVMDQLLEDGSSFSWHYTVTVWNNPEDQGGAINDTDQLLCVRSIATGPKGTTVGIEVTLIGQSSGEAITGYFAQAGGGSGKNYNSRDVQAISDFTVQ